VDIVDARCNYEVRNLFYMYCDLEKWDSFNSKILIPCPHPHVNFYVKISGINKPDYEIFATAR